MKKLKCLHTTTTAATTTVTTTQLSLKGRTTDSNAVDNNGVSETKTPSFISSKDAN